MEDRQLLAFVCTVNSNGDNPLLDVDDGRLTLREAIRIINGSYVNYQNSIGHDGFQVRVIAGNVNQIDFKLSGATTIAPLAQLDAVAKTTLIGPSASTGVPSVTLLGSSAVPSVPGGTVDGLTINASNSEVQGLIIVRWTGAGVTIKGGTNSQIDSNYIGVTAVGAPGPNGIGVQITGGSSNTIGGGTALANIISGNLQAGIRIAGSSSNVVTGNAIGLDPGQGQAQPNQGPGILISGASTRNTIGGTLVTERNLISGNALAGIAIQGPGPSQTKIQGNYIGLDVSGTAAVGNGAGAGGAGANLPGISISDSSQNTIGAVTGTTGANVIAGNGSGDGVFISGSAATGNLVQGNLIGVATDGVTPLPNSLNGVTIENASQNTVSGNVLAANGSNGLEIRTRTSVDTASGNVVQGNFIGTDRLGTARIGNTLNGILLTTASGNSIGGATTGNGNTIVANYDGVVLQSGSNANVVQGNLIGVNAAGLAIPNKRNGVTILASDDNTIGRGYARSAYSGGLPDAANTLAYNAFPSGVVGGAGVYIASGTGNTVLSNSIYNNLGIGIDLAPLGGNGQSAGSGNFPIAPVLKAVQSGSGVTRVRGSLTGAPNTFYLVEFFSNATTDPNASVSGRTFLDSRVVKTDENGLAALVDGPASTSLTLGVSVADGLLVTATATSLTADPAPLPNQPQTYTADSTSEFSGAATVNAVADLAVTLSVDPGAEVGLNAPLTYTAVISNVGPNTATGVVLTDVLPANVKLVSVSSTGGPTITDSSLTTINYPIASIASGVSITVTILVTPTALTLPGQGILNSVSVTANEVDSKPSNNSATSPTDPNGVTVKIIPGSLGFPKASALVQEPAKGDATRTATITVNRTAGFNGVVTVDYATAFLSAADQANSPTQSLPSGTLTFGEGEASKTITIPLVHSDSFQDVSLVVTLSNPTGGADLAAIASTTLVIASIDQVPLPAGDLQFSVASYSAAESGGSATVLVTRTGGSAGVVTVTVSTAGGSATAGRDYTAVTQTVTFQDGDIAPKAVTVPILGNGLYLGTQTVGLALSSPTGGAAIGTLASAQLVILESDPAPPPSPASLQFNAATAAVLESAGTVTLTVTRTGDTSKAVTVSYSTADGTAVGGRDYASTSGTLSFGPGQTSQTITVALIANGSVTPALSFQILLSNPGDGAIVGGLNAVTVSVTNTDLDTTGAAVTDLRTIPASRGPGGFVLTFNSALDRASATNTNNYEVIELGPNGSPKRGSGRVALRAAQLDASGTVLTLTPQQGLEANRFYQVVVFADPGRGVVGTNGNLIDGDGNGKAGGSFVASVGRGTSLDYIDGSGNLVRLGLARGGVMELTRSSTGEGQRLTLSGVRKHRTILSASVRRRGVASTGRTTINAIDGAGSFGDVFIKATTPPVVVGSITPAGVRSKFQS